LPAAVQQTIRSHLAEGDKAWAFYKEQGIADGLNGSLSNFADAYREHPRDREAVRGLKRVADEILKRARSDPSALHDTARALAESSDFLKSYAPVVEALER